MRRQDALQLVGQRVSAWTSANGVYTGTLVGITDNSPWRGRVLIDSVLECGVHYERGQAVYGRGKRVGGTIEVGGSSIRACDAVGLPDYGDGIRAHAEKFSRAYADYRNGLYGNPEDPSAARTYAWMGAAADAYRKVADVRAALEPLDRMLETAEGRAAVRNAARGMAGDGLVPGREHLLADPDYAWDVLAMSVARDNAIAGRDPGFLATLMSRLNLGEPAPDAPAARP